MDALLGALKSKVMWFNVITAALETLSATTGIPSGTMMVVNVVGNMALRFLTTNSLSDKAVK